MRHGDATAGARRPLMDLPFLCGFTLVPLCLVPFRVVAHCFRNALSAKVAFLGSEPFRVQDVGKVPSSSNFTCPAISLV